MIFFLVFVVVVVVVVVVVAVFCVCNKCVRHLLCMEINLDSLTVLNSLPSGSKHCMNQFFALFN